MTDPEWPDYIDPLPEMTPEELRAERARLLAKVKEAERALAAPARDTQPVARDWMSRNVNEFAGAFNRRYEETGSLRESMMYAFVTVYDAAMASPVRQEET